MARIRVKLFLDQQPAEMATFSSLDLIALSQAIKPLFSEFDDAVPEVKEDDSTFFLQLKAETLSIPLYYILQGATHKLWNRNIAVSPNSYSLRIWPALVEVRFEVDMEYDPDQLYEEYRLDREMDMWE